MSVTTWDPTKIRARAGKIFLLANPYTAASPPTGTTPATYLATYLANFYTDGSTQTAMAGGLTPWANVEAKGFDFDAKYKSVMFDPAVGLPINAGKYLESAIGSCSIADMSVAKFIDILSATSNEVITIAKGVSQAAKSAILLGVTPYNTRYMALYQWPSLDTTGTPIVGQYDNLFMPRVCIDPDIKVTFAKSKVSEITVKLVPESDLWLVSPDSGMYAAAVYQETTSAHT